MKTDCLKTYGMTNRKVKGASQAYHTAEGKPTNNRSITKAYQQVVTALTMNATL